ncbi:MAG: hypothetical protein OMM_10248, partial [Candidatus Magnetoglobus multicellularis str. Araruama]
KKLFGEESSKPQLLSFINAFLELENMDKIVDLEFRNLEKLGLSKIDRKTIYDIYCTDEKGNHIIVELQRAEQNYFKDRMIYYSTFPIQEQGIKGLFYDGKALDRQGKLRKVSWDYGLKAVYCIGILDFEIKESVSNDYIHYINLRDQHGKVFYDKLKYIFVEMPKFIKQENELETFLDKWFFFLRNLDYLQEIPEIFNNDNVIRDAFKKAKFINLPKAEQGIYLESLKQYRDWSAVLETAEKKGYDKAKEEIVKAQEREAEAQKEKTEAQKREAEAIKKIENGIKNFSNLGLTIKKIAEAMDIEVVKVQEILNK